MQQDERDMVGSLHPQVIARENGVKWLLDQIKSGIITEEQLMEALGIRELQRARPIPPSLDELADKYGTDKGPSEHNYTPLYGERFWLRRYDELTLLELGIWKGASLRMWRDYFPNATIIGLDRTKPLDTSEWGDVVLAGGDQADEKLINHLGSLYGPFHIVIDDASHISSKTIASFKMLWPHVAPGGIYVIEDLQTSYDPKHYGYDEACRMPGGVVDWLRPTAMQWCKGLADEVNAGLYPDQYRLGYDIASVEFHLNICFITKAGKWAAE